MHDFGWKMEHSKFLAGLILAALLPQVSPFKLDEIEDRVFLSCNASIMRLEGTMGELSSEDKSMDLGRRILDPRGVYQCNRTDDKTDQVSIMQVYYRMCQNCVELDSATLVGIIITDIIATLLLAVGVYCFAGHETGRSSGAMDTQVLLRNEQVYQPLRERDDGQYSHLGGNRPRKK
ncbi:T-cell surface glycoprotein CD3 delta chain [Choloepus didactylus]|uniref:T-cell surface glycoprotein CD3 delta chain n=1 Tax=Choloepus didactylus TaxID=27675 RepID=UPI0018A05CDD|nr:T-cell surface glycoprotein CD3 delta chain [Choloepus didactylus]